MRYHAVRGWCCGQRGCSRCLGSWATVGCWAGCPAGVQCRLRGTRAVVQVKPRALPTPELFLQLLLCTRKATHRSLKAHLLQCFLSQEPLQQIRQRVQLQSAAGAGVAVRVLFSFLVLSCILPAEPFGSQGRRSSLLQASCRRCCCQPAAGLPSAAGGLQQQELSWCCCLSCWCC